MEEIKKQFEVKYGYTPTGYEIVSMYLSGQLILNDKQENELINYLTSKDK